MIFTATGCARCKIVKRYLDEHQIGYVEKDVKAEGKDEFQTFYKANRKAIFRGSDGIEFPIIVDGNTIHQSIGAAIAYLHAGEKLEGFFSEGTLHKEWVDGIHLSEGNPAYKDEFIQVLQHIKSNALKLQIDTDGRNSGILQQVIEEGLADVLIMNVLAPLELYPQILGYAAEDSDIVKSLSLVSRFPAAKFQTIIQPVKRKDGSLSYLTPSEVAATAKLIQDTTGSNKCIYTLKRMSQESERPAGQGIEPLSPNQLLSYRSKARAYQVYTEIEKS
ncbi:hypothetical protein REC12_13430 [Desulfosporosinus sp. PR]|uniref:glutaredoxin family protein n=1 Tax=Candidatus Desulfosporosinus nitrosoreducens TaxID=3401928 RepID=UPI0027F03CBC|nr:hypothetical protein [Desulfosporosinus sp. PR]MDQ7094592.1 hypothetical protein [Desulfosporosinus sp. PR]